MGQHQTHRSKRTAPALRAAPNAGFNPRETVRLNVRNGSPDSKQFDLASPRTALLIHRFGPLDRAPLPLPVLSARLFMFFDLLARFLHQASCAKCQSLFRPSIAPSACSSPAQGLFRLLSLSSTLFWLSQVHSCSITPQQSPHLFITRCSAVGLDALAQEQR